MAKHDHTCTDPHHHVDDAAHLLGDERAGVERGAADRLELRAHADEPDLVGRDGPVRGPLGPAQRVRHGPFRQARGQGGAHPLAVALPLDPGGLSGAVPDRGGEGVPVGDRPPVEGEHGVAGAQSRLVGGPGGIARAAVLCPAGGGAGLLLLRRDHAPVDLGDGGAGLRGAHRGDQQGGGAQRDEQVHERPAEHDHHALPHRQGEEAAVLVAGADLLGGLGPRVVGHAAQLLDEARGRRAGRLPGPRRGQHPDHRDVAAQRDGLEPVLRLAAAPRDERRAEADHVLRDAHAEELGRDEVADLVQGDRDRQAQRDREDARDVPEDLHDGHQRARAARRAQASAASTASTVSPVGAGSWPAAASTCSGA